jgi:hypothetical protein
MSAKDIIFDERARAAVGRGGAALAIGTLVLGVDGMALAQAASDPIRTMLAGHPFWWIIYLVMAVGGIFVQWRTSLLYTVEAYDNRI